MGVNVLHVIGSLEKGGAESLVADYCNHNKDKEISTYVISFKDGYNNTGINDFITPIKIIKRKRSFDMPLILEARRFIIKNKINIVHAHQPIDAIHLVFATILLKNTRVVMTYHGFNKINSFKFSLFYKFLLHYLSANLFVSESVRNIFETKYRIITSRNWTIHNGLDFTRLSRSNKLDLAAELNIPKDSIIIGMIGNFNVVRDQQFLCDCMDEILSLNTNIHFIFVGRKEPNAPGYFDKCLLTIRSKNISHRVHFMGFRNDIASILYNLSAFVYSSRIDTFGIAVVEAMYAGIPCIVNDIEAFKEITNYGEFAFIYKTRQKGSLLEKIKLVVLNDPQIIRISQQARLMVMEKFNIVNYSTRVNSLYSVLLNN